MDATLFNMLPVEVQETVAQFLNQQDLSVCVRVCQAWKTLFRPHLWSHVVLFWNAKDVLCKINFSRALETNKHFIRSLRLTFSSNGLLYSFLQCCPAYFPNLTAAYVEASFEHDFDDEFARFISLSSPGWKRLIFHKCQKLHSKVSFRTNASKALLSHAPTLEILRANFKSEIDWGLVDELLCSAPNLKELYLQGDHETVFGGWLDAAAIVNSKWVCSDLEVLGCRIANIPRPDISRRINDEPASFHVQKGTLQESIGLQRQIYSKIARFTKLRELTLGFPILTDVDEDLDGYMDYYRQYDCLAMTVESGLDLLKGLKELRKVDLTNMEVYIDNETEQRWFKENWPQAKIGCAGDF